MHTIVVLVITVILFQEILQPVELSLITMFLLFEIFCAFLTSFFEELVPVSLSPLKLSHTGYFAYQTFISMMAHQQLCKNLLHDEPCCNVITSPARGDILSWSVDLFVERVTLTDRFWINIVSLLFGGMRRAINYRSGERTANRVNCFLFVLLLFDSKVSRSFFLVTFEALGFFKNKSLGAMQSYLFDNTIVWSNTLNCQYLRQGKVVMCHLIQFSCQGDQLS